MVTVHYVVITSPNDIFGSVGRCGAGYNTVWEDWSPKGRENHRKINEEYEKELDKRVGHYKKLEKDILENGFKNPLIVTCGKPLHRKMTHLPPELRTKPDHQLLIMEGTDGGSRLWVAQKHNLPVPCIINDRTGKFREHPRITSPNQATRYFATTPKRARITRQQGFVAGGLVPLHMEQYWSDVDELNKIRVPLWHSLMKKYGYNVYIKPHLRKFLVPSADEKVVINNNKTTNNEPNVTYQGRIDEN